MSAAAVCCLLLTAVAGPAPASPPPDDPLPAAETWLEARRAYDEGDYGRAVAAYQRLLAAGHDSGRLRYNLGNAYLRSGELGRAVASYLRGRRQLPRDEDLRANLEFARQSARDAIAPPAPAPLLTTLFFWHFALSPTELAWLVVGLNLLLWGTLGLRLWRPQLPGTRGAAVLFLVLLVACGSSLALRHLRPQRVAVVVPAQVPAYSAPDADSLTRFKLHAGSEVELRGRRDGWLRIALPDGEQGWIERDWAELVEL